MTNNTQFKTLAEHLAKSKEADDHAVNPCQLYADMPKIT